MVGSLLSALLCLAAVERTAGYKPVIMMHGVGSGATEMAEVQKLIESGHPGTVATSLPLYEGKVKALTPLKTQVTGVIKRIRQMVRTIATVRTPLSRRGTDNRLSPPTGGGGQGAVRQRVPPRLQVAGGADLPLRDRGNGRPRRRHLCFTGRAARR